MRQQLVIQFLPLEVLLFALLVGWLAVGLVRELIDGPLTESGNPAASAAPALVQSAEAAEGPSATLISPVFTREVQRWAPQLVAWAQQAGIDPNLAATVMQIESCGDPQAVSIAGAQGLFQVMPFHFEAGESMLDPDTNALRGLNYLALGFARAGGQPGLALAGYNGGHSVIGKDPSLWAAETRSYYYWGTGIYQAATSGATVSDRLGEWLAAGGEGLCRQASDRLGLPN